MKICLLKRKHNENDSTKSTNTFTLGNKEIIHHHLHHYQ